MKKLVCEMCGGADLVKQDGVFVCQNCGTKYSVEEAKKMMMEGSVSIEGTVAIEGTVKVDKSEELKKLFALARRAKKADNTENAARYYTEIEMQDPNSWEAYFYLIYFTARNTRVKDIPKDCKNLNNCFATTMDLLFQSTSDRQEILEALNMMYEDIQHLFEIMLDSANDLTSNFSNLNSLAYNEAVRDSMLDTFRYKEAALMMFYNFGASIINANEEYANFAADVWKTELSLFMDYYNKKTNHDRIKATYSFFVKGNAGKIGYAAKATFTIAKLIEDIYKIDATYDDPLGIAKKLRQNEEFITCPKCGKSFRERESACPECGCTKQEIEQIEEELRIQAEQEAEKERIREEQEAAEARIKAEQEAAEQAARRKEWWQKNYKKVIISIIILIGIIGAAFFALNHQAKLEKEKVRTIVMQAFDLADSCIKVNDFDKAEEYYRLALDYYSNVEYDEWRGYACCVRLTELEVARNNYQSMLNNSKVNSSNTTLTNTELWEAFESAYINYYNVSSLNCSTYSLEKGNIQNFLYAGKKEGADISRILTDYSSDWKWLGDYIQEVNGTQITSEIRWRFSVVAFFLANEGDSRYNVDFSWAGKPEAWRSAYQDAQ